MAEAIWIYMPQLISTFTTQPIESQFSALTTNADRVQFCLAQKEVQRLFVSKFVSNPNRLKCSTTARNYREDGNDHFRGQKFDDAIQLYTQAICFAPQTEGETASELSLAFGNRSAAYFQLGQHENALKDINDALALGYGQFKPATKLQLRKCDCLIQLGRASEAEEFQHFLQKPTNDENDTKRWIELFGRIRLGDDTKKANDSKPKVCDISLISKLTNKGLFKSNPKMSSFSAKVAVQYDEVKGRHLVALEDIQFGDILAVSRPYYRPYTLFNPDYDILKHCLHCCRFIWFESNPFRPVPCTSCSSVVYCSEECRTESANAHHRYECGQTDLLIQLPEFARMSLRLLYRAGMDQIISVVNSSPEDASHLSEQPDDHYSHVYQLVHHSDGPLKDLNISYDEMLKSSIWACFLLQLAKKSNFPMDSKEEEKLIGGILLRHLLQSRYNTFAYSPLYVDKELRITPGGVGHSPSVLLDLYPTFASTLNHSCRANARLESPDHQSVCLQAAQPISAGTEITIFYLDKDELDSRFPIAPVQFKSRYLVDCFCALCTYYARNTTFGLADGKFVRCLELSCSACHHGLMELSYEHIFKLEVFSCTNCRLTMTNAEMQERYCEIDRFSDFFAQLFHGGKNYPPWELLGVVQLLEDLLHRDCGLLSGFRFYLGVRYLSNGQMDNAWACFEQYLSIYGRIFGEESVSLMEAINFIRKVLLGIMSDEMLMSFDETLLTEMKDFEQQDSVSARQYLARLEQLKQLKLKYYKDY